MRTDKVKAEWKAFREELRTGSDRGFFHNYVDLFVEKNRHMPYTWGHLEAVVYPLLLGIAIYGWAS